MSGAAGGHAMRNPFLVGERVYLRAIEEADAAACYTWISDPEVRVHLAMRSRPNTEKESLEYIRSIDQRRHQMFAIVTRADGVYVGNIDLMDIRLADRAAEVGMVIGRKDYQQKGLGREALRLVCAHAFRTLNLHRVSLRVYATNDRAIKAYTAVGFKPEGRLRDDAFIDGRYVDTIVMGLLRGELDAGAGPA
jgi:RimJ/RimL family protein N-acetyltransferase